MTDARLRIVDEHGPPDDRIVPPPSNPLAVAEMFRAERFASLDGAALLRHYRGGFYSWTGTCWPEAEERRIRSDIYRWLGPARYWKKAKGESELVPFEPTRRKVADIIEALQALAHLEASEVPPAWIDPGQGWSGQTPHPNAHEIVAMANGLLHLPTRTLLPHSPAFFVQHSLPFDFDPSAPQPQRWHRFLRELWPDDRQSIRSLGEIFGYVLSADTSQQKMFMAIGPRRSGKGTIARVLTGLLGAHNVAGPTLAGLTSNFGLSPLIDKPLAVISDARLGSRVDGLVAVERLLSISGEDALTIDRKYRDPWTGRLPTRFLILTNELPRFTDSSGALASRFVLLTLTESFYEREDPMLTETLLDEAPGIFDWALTGLDRLLERGHFLQPKSAREALRHLEDLSSPVGAFIRDRCTTGPASEVDKDVLYAAWKTWCDEEGRDRPGTKAVFIRDLRAAVPGIKASRPRADEERRHVLVGIDLAKSRTNSGGNP